MIKKFLPLLVISVLFITVSCSSDNDYDMGPIEDPVTYTLDIKGIITANCLSCHGATTTNGAPSSLHTFTTVKNAVQNLNLIGRVENGSMPPAGNLTSMQINLIKDWRSDGYVE